MFNSIKNLFSETKKEVGVTSCKSNVEEGENKINTEYENLRKKGNTYLSKGELDKAVECYRQALLLMPRNVNAHINLGFALKEFEQVDEAELCLRDAIALDVSNVDAYYLLAGVLRIKGDKEEAILNYEKALELKPDFVPGYQDLFAVLMEHGRVNKAKATLARAINLLPGHVIFHFWQGKLCMMAGEIEQAFVALSKAVSLDATFAEAFIDLGKVLAKQGKFVGAEQAFQKALSLSPEHMDVHNELGMVQHQQGKLEEAIVSYYRAIAHNPNLAVAHNNLASVFQSQGRLDEAIRHLKIAIQAAPHFAEAYKNLCLACMLEGAKEVAIDYGRQAVALNPEYAEAYAALGDAYGATGNNREASKAYLRAITLNPTLEGAHNNLGNIYKTEGKFELAIEQYRVAVQLKPGFTLAHVNLGIAFMESGHLDEAIMNFQNAIGADPVSVEAHVSMALCLLTQGNFKQGWQEYEWRYRYKDGREYLTHPRDAKRILPRPSTLVSKTFEGKKIGLLADQGIGDEVFFLRFAKEFKRRGAWVGYVSSPKLSTILSRCTEIDVVISAENFPPDVDIWISVGDSPLLLDVSRINELPSPLLLCAEPKRLVSMAERLHALGEGPYLGVTWRAGSQVSQGNLQNLFKSVPVEEFAQALRDWPGKVLVLQRHPTATEIRNFEHILGREVHDFSALNENLEDMLALLDLLDGYVGVSNTNMHLRSGLAKDAAVLVTNPPEWRWMEHGDQSPWFPEFHLFRQIEGRGWQAALEALREYLQMKRGAV